ncbi:MAG: molybdenum cofactor guanylyltransferase [Candidatus Aminicenantes bacterium]|nr:molybdenum cofactor guanylyltransferase [Candidatus Aminicenantes bacterium]
MEKNKALLTISGFTLIERVVRNLEPYFGEILISAQNPALFDFLPYKIITDEQPGQGPVMGILSGLRASANEVNFVTGCDIPDIDVSFLERMIAYTSGYDVVVPVSGEDKYEPLFAFYNKSVIRCIDQLLARGHRKIIKLFPMCRTKYISFENSGWYRNLNTMADYRAYVEKTNND